MADSARQLVAARDAGFPQIDAIFKFKQELEVASSLADVASSVRQLIPLIGEITPAIGIAEVKSHDTIQTALQRAFIWLWVRVATRSKWRHDLVFRCRE